MKYIDSSKLPPSLEKAWIESLISVKASSCSDPKLVKALRLFSEVDENVQYLDELPTEAEFELNGKVFRKGALRRKRYLCLEVKSNKKYLISSTAEVEAKK